MAGISLKIMSIGLTVIGAILTLATNWVEDKKIDEKIEEKVNEALAERENDEEES